MVGSARRWPAAVIACLFVCCAIVVQAGPATAAARRWKIVASPNPETIENIFDSISCPAANSCVGVGQLQSGHPLTAAWNGTTWSVMPSPVPTDWSTLLGVSCVSSSYCVAVGTTTWSAMFSEVWDGSSWTILPTPSPDPQYNVLTAVSCASETLCVAVGYGGQQDVDATPAIELWNGTDWSIMQAARGHVSGQLQGVSCSTALRCTAVGEPSNDPGGELIEQWNGTRWVVALNRPASASDPKRLFAVSCVNPSYCVAVGGDPHTLVDVWNGTTWSTVPSPNPSDSFNILQGVECRRVARCIAVGAKSNGTGYAPLIEAWDGTSWYAMKSPIPPSTNSGLPSVSCDPLKTCVAVGYLDGSGQPKTLAMVRRAPN